jgi:hypothetical protein
MALALALITTIIGEGRVARQEKHDARIELRGLVQRLTALPTENLRILDTFRDNPAAVGQAASNLQTEQIVLAQQAADVIGELGDSVTASEYYAVGYALSLAGDAGASLTLLERGLSAKGGFDPVGRSALLRAAAVQLFITADAPRGRQRFQQALDVWDYTGAVPASAAYHAAFTELLWAQTELNGGQCGLAAQHAARAEAHMEPGSASAQVIRPQLQTLTSRLAAQCPPAEA